MNDRTATSHTPDLTFQWNGGRAPITIARVAVGQYQVTIPGLSTSGQGVGGHVQVSPYGGSNSSGSTYAKDFSSIYFAPLSSQATQQISGYVQLLLANHDVEVGAPPAAVASRSPTPLVRIYGAQYGGPVI